MRAEEIIDNRFIKPLLNKKTGTIGVELEFPMLNLKKMPIEIKVANLLLDYFQQNGFKTVEATTENTPAFIENSFGDVLSFDNSYNNFEFSMNYGTDLNELQSRFKNYYQMANSFLAGYNYTLTGMGTNPYKKYIKQSHVSYPVYNMVDEFLHRGKCSCCHEFPDFPAYLSSVQTHLDINFNDLPKTYNLFAKIAFARVLLFGNSLGFGGEKVLCYRDFLWEKSAFGCIGTITGKIDNEINDTTDIVNSFLNRKMFNRVRNGNYEIISPVLVKDYFEDERYGAQESDIEQFLSFRDVETTYRGTLEIRGDCTQPAFNAFMPPAFNFGLAHNIDNAIKLTNEFFNKNNIEKSNTDLRNEAIYSGKISSVNEEKLTEYLVDLVLLATDGLKGRGKNEQVLLDGLLDRAKNLTCPAKNTYKHISDGKAIEDIILRYSEV